jgi:hypothetical protein
MRVEGGERRGRIPENVMSLQSYKELKVWQAAMDLAEQ